MFGSVYAYAVYTPVAQKARRGWVGANLRLLKRAAKLHAAGKTYAECDLLVPPPAGVRGWYYARGAMAKVS